MAPYKSIDSKSSSIRMMPLISSFVVVAVLVGPAAAMTGQNSPQDYPQWRGQNRDGAASAFSKPESWPENLRLKWKVEVGAGYATPIVVGNTVYAFTRSDGKEGMTALDAETGETAFEVHVFADSDFLGCYVKWPEGRSRVLFITWEVLGPELPSHVQQWLNDEANRDYLLKLWDDLNSP